ncbi:MAG: molybdate ABC transporter permease subunit [Akkermansiaceae bacterium]|nr:molybdate ABC transporter permease subunit [Akkermansiaceae bacterium]MDP4847587.1 molybdate ABC transporter permease subunit [Akkermansiaceae bacterium]
MTPTDWQMLALTFGLASLAVLLALPFATALAWLLARKEWPGKTLAETLAMLPMVMPPVATGLILLKLFGKTGAIGSWLSSFGIEIIFTWKAVVLALAVMAFPLLVRTLRTAFEDVPAHLEAAALSLGGGRFNVFRKITLPLAKRGIIAGILLAFARAIGEFGATIMVAGFIPGITETLSLSIYRSVQTGDDSRALTLVAISALIAFAAVFISSKISPRRVK